MFFPIAKMKLNPIFKTLARPIYDASPNTRYDYEKPDFAASSASVPGAASSASSASVPGAASATTLSDEDFWNGIEHLGWQDRSDHIMNPASVRAQLCSRFKPEEMQNFVDRLWECMEEIREVLLNSGQSEELITDALLSHIVGKGMIFYTCVLDDPDFAMYLTVGEGEDVQDLWSIARDCP
jgi:hypothetical protein